MTLMEARCAVWAASNLCRGKDPPVNLEEVSNFVKTELHSSFRDAKSAFAKMSHPFCEVLVHSFFRILLEQIS